MIYELKRSLIKEMEKALDKLNNGYYVNLSSIVDTIFYINMQVFCGPNMSLSSEENGDCSPLCAPGCNPIPITTNSPSCTYTGGIALYLELSCSANGGIAIIVINPNLTTTTTTTKAPTTLPPDNPCITTTLPPTTTTTTENLNCYYGGGNSAVYIP
jgi:hypothetical protein